MGSGAASQSKGMQHRSFKVYAMEMVTLDMKKGERSEGAPLRRKHVAD